MNQNNTSLTVKKEDIVEYSSSEARADAVGAWGFGMLGFLPLAVGTGLFDSLVLFLPSLFLGVWVTVGFALAMLTYYARPAILQRLFAGRDFQNVIQRHRGFVYRSYALAITLAIIGVPLSYSSTAEWRSAGLVLAGLTYFVMVPGFTTPRVLKPNNEARLCILQFLTEKSTGNPRHFWLRRGLRTVENRFPEFGVSVPRHTLSLGCSYRIAKGIAVESDLLSLSDWVSNPNNRLVPGVTRFLLSAGDARALGMFPPQTLRDRVRKLPWEHIMVLVAAILGALLEPLTSFIRKALGLS